MIKELATVALCRDLDEYGLRKGDIGAGVHVYSKGGAYEVEFVTGGGDTIAVVTLREEDVRLIQNEEILHVRTILAKEA